MKRKSNLGSAGVWIVAILILVVGLSSANAQGKGRTAERNDVNRDNPNGNYNPTYNPNQIALLRWYQANTGSTVFSVPPGSSGTNGIAFDGANIWVASYLTGMLNEFSINGQLLNTINIGGRPIGLTYDGSNIWVANNHSPKLQKVQVIPPYTVTTVSVGGMSTAYFLAFDGARVWVTDNIGDAVYAVGINAPYPAQKFNVGAGPTGIAFDGDCMWVTNTNDGTVWTVPVPGLQCQLSYGPVNWRTSSSAQPFDIAYDGINMWVSVRFANQVVELDDSVTPGYLLRTITVGTQPQGIAFDGAYIWVANSGSANLTKMAASNNPNAGAGDIIGTYNVGSGTPNKLAFDGASIWMTLGGVFVGKM